MLAFLKKHRALILTSCLYAVPVVIVVSCHVPNMYRDADLNVSRLGTWEADEGFYTYNAVNLVRYGKLITPNDLNFVLHCPFLTLIQSCYFRVLGVSIPASRIQGVVSFVAGLLLVWLLWRRLKLAGIGLVSVYIISFNYMLFAYTRLGLAEAHAGLLFALITYLIFHKAKVSVSYRKATLLGAVSFFATFVKPSMFVLPAAVGAFMFASLLDKRDKRNAADAVKKFGAFAGVFLCLSLLVVVFLVLPHRLEWNLEQQSLWGSTISVRYIGMAFLCLFRLLQQVITDPWDGLPFLLALSSVPVLARNISTRRTDVLDKLQIWCWCVVVMQIAAVGVNWYQPSRYYVAVIWPLGLINSAYFFRLAAFFTENRADRFGSVYRHVPLVAAILSFYLSNSIPPILIDAVLIAFVVAVCLPDRRKAAMLLYPAIFAILPIGCFGFSYLNWTGTAGQSLYEAFADIGSRIPRDCIVMGRMAPFVALTHPCKAYASPAALDGNNPCPDYLILNKGLNELDEWVKTNNKVNACLKYGWDKSFRPLKYRIMENYYSGKNTIVLKVKMGP